MAVTVAAIEAKDAVHSEEWKVSEDDFNQTMDTIPPGSMLKCLAALADAKHLNTWGFQCFY